MSLDNFFAVIDDTTFSTGGVDDFTYLDVINDTIQGMGAPAKGMIVKNKSGTAQVIYIQITGPKGQKCKTFSVAKGDTLTINPDMKMEIAEVTMWGNTSSAIGQVLLFKG
jgi:hypothetical protein